MFTGLLFDTKLLFAVNHASKIGFFTFKTLVESTGVHGKIEEFAFIGATLELIALILIKSFPFCYQKCLFFDFPAELF